MPMSKADAILHPVRMRILQTLATGLSGRTMTAREIGQVLPDVAQASIYRHLARLVDADVVEVVEEHKVRNTIERVYGLPNGAAVLTRDEMLGLSRAEHLHYFTTFMAGLLGDYARYLERADVDFVRDGVGYRELILNLSDDEMVEFTGAVSDVILPYLKLEPAAHRRRRVLASIVIPVDESSGADERS